MSNSNYFPALDGLRGILALGVITAHCNIAWFPGAPIMMELFFVVSGFLITSILLREVEKTGTVSLLKFWKRRLLRLSPALVVAVSTTFVVSFFIVDDMWPILADGLSSILYYSNWTKLYDYHYPTIFGQTWSLSIEEQFYLIWPTLLTLVLFFRLRTYQIVFLLLLLAVVTTLWRHYLISQEVPWSRVYYALETRMDAFVMGAILAMSFGVVRHWSHNTWWHYFLYACSLALIVLFIIGRPFEITYFIWQQSMAIVLSAAAILLLTSPRGSLLKRLCSSRVMVYLGERCYGLYLWHWPIIWLLLTETDVSKVTIVLITFPLTILLSALSYTYIEMPFLSKKPATLRARKKSASVPVKPA